jgi:hypothetical protein
VGCGNIYFIVPQPTLSLKPTNQKKTHMNTENSAHLISLGSVENNEIIWDINWNTEIPLAAPNSTVAKAMYRKVVAHVTNYPEELDYCAIDLPGTMFDDNDNNADRVAQNLDEAVALSTLLQTELEERIDGKTGPQLIILLNNWNNLFKIKDVEQAQLYMELWSSLQKVIRNGGAYGINTLMQVPSTDPDLPEI